MTHQLRILVCALWLFVSAGILAAQTTTPTPAPTPTPLPLPKSTPLEGKTELQNVKIEPTLLTYDAMNQIADIMIRDIAVHPHVGTLVFLDKAQRANLDQYRATRADLYMQLARLVSRYADLSKSYCSLFACTGPPDGIVGAAALTTFTDVRLLSIRIELARGSLLMDAVKPGSTDGPAESKGKGGTAGDKLSLLGNSIERQVASLRPVITDDREKKFLDDAVALAKSYKKVAGVKAELDKEEPFSPNGTHYGLFFRIGRPRSLANRHKIETLNQSLEAFKGEARVAGGAVGAISALNPYSFALTTGIEYAADLLAMFRTNTLITGIEVSPDKEALIAAIANANANALGMDGKQVAGFRILHPGKYFSPSPNNSPLLGNIHAISDERQRSERYVMQHSVEVNAAIGEINRRKAIVQKQLDSIDKLVADLEGLRAKAKDTTELGKIQDEIDSYQDKRLDAADDMEPLEGALYVLNMAKAHIDAINDLNTQTSQIIAGLMTSNGTDESKAAAFLRAEALQKTLANGDDPDAFNVLDVNIPAGGGNDRTQKSLLKYFSGSRADFSGGLIVSYQLFTAAGDLSYGGAVRCYTGYVQSKDIVGATASSIVCKLVKAGDQPEEKDKPKRKHGE